MKIPTKIKDPSVVQPTCWACFRYGAQACRLSFPSSYVPSGTPARGFGLVLFSYLFVACVIPPGGFLMVGKVLVSSLFRLSLPFFLSLSTVASRFLPFSSLASYIFFLRASRYGGLAEISSGECLVLFSKPRCNSSGHPLSVRVGHKACSRSFLRWCDSYFLCYFGDNPRQDWHDRSTVSPWP